MSFLADALAAATLRGVSLEILLPTRSTHAGSALDELPVGGDVDLTGSSSLVYCSRAPDRGDSQLGNADRHSYTSAVMPMRRRPLSNWPGNQALTIIA